MFGSLAAWKEVAQEDVEAVPGDVDGQRFRAEQARAEGEMVDRRPVDTHLALLSPPLSPLSPLHQMSDADYVEDLPQAERVARVSKLVLQAPPGEINEVVNGAPAVPWSPRPAGLSAERAASLPSPPPQTPSSS
jgi:hypothetical protein